MKILVDATFPDTIHRTPNAAGIEVDRVKEGIGDAALLEYAVTHGYSALVFLDAEMVARSELPDRARRDGVTLICSSIDDPLEAEVNLRRWLNSIPDYLAGQAPDVWWLRKDGLRRQQN